jgi:hypothetical protein
LLNEPTPIGDLVGSVIPSVNRFCAFISVTKVPQHPQRVCWRQKDAPTGVARLALPAQLDCIKPGNTSEERRSLGSFELHRVSYQVGESLGVCADCVNMGCEVDHLDNPKPVRPFFGHRSRREVLFANAMEHFLACSQERLGAWNSVKVCVLLEHQFYIRGRPSLPEGH